MRDNPDQPPESSRTGAADKDQDASRDYDNLWLVTLRQFRRLFVFVIGMTVVLIGVIMFFTPGPAVVVIPLGLGILALEFAWARLLLRRFRDKAGEVGTEIRGMWGRPAKPREVAAEEAAKPARRPDSGLDADGG